MAPVTDVSEGIVKPSNQFGCLDVCRVLIPERAPLHTEDEPERLHVGRQVRQREGDRLPLAKIVKLEGPEIAHQNVARAVALGQGIEIPPGLFVGPGKIPPGTLLLDDQYAGPEQVDVAVAVVQFPDVLLVSGDRTPPHAENLEKVVVETLSLALLVSRIPPPVGEVGSPGANFIPG